MLKDQMENSNPDQIKATKIKILLVDDQPVVLKGLKMLFALESDIQVVAEASDGLTALRLAKETRPDLVVMDLELPLMDGISTTKALLQWDAEMKVIILSFHADPASQERAQKAGAIAYVEKRDGAARLLKEIRKAFEAR